MSDALKGLYHPVILQHNKAPVAFEKYPEAEYVLKAYNPICGDRFHLFFDIDEEDRVRELQFHGFGCAVSKASTSILVKHLEGKNRTELFSIINDFKKVMNGEDDGAPADFKAFSAARAFPERRKCATLSWDTLYEFLNEAS